MPVWCSRNIRTEALAPVLVALLVLLSGGQQAFAQPSLGGGGGLGSEPTFLDVEDAFRWHTLRHSDRQLTIQWDVAPGYYLYREQFRFVRVDNGAELAATLPDGRNHHDAYFGDVEVYHDSVSATIDLPDELSGPLELQVRFQGCAEAGLCYPPQTETITIDP
ncbi:MAG: protein-disulfide reductase DsbD domain-containing protein [Pseudomonadota bacterium]